MNKAELIEQIAKSADISKAAAERALDATVASIKTALRRTSMVTLVGFGTFYVGKRAARTGRNPRTGAAIKIKAARVPKFRAGKALEGCDKLSAPSRQCASGGRVLSSAGRASPLQGECRRFDPVSTHQHRGDHGRVRDTEW